MHYFKYKELKRNFSNKQTESPVNYFMAINKTLTLI